jgi:hypothetical protein
VPEPGLQAPPADLSLPEVLVAVAAGAEDGPAIVQVDQPDAFEPRGSIRLPQKRVQTARCVDREPGGEEVGGIEAHADRPRDPAKKLVQFAEIPAHRIPAPRAPLQEQAGPRGARGGAPPPPPPPPPRPPPPRNPPTRSTPAAKPSPRWDPMWVTTPCAPARAPNRRASARAAADLRRISGSGEARLIR